MVCPIGISCLGLWVKFFLSKDLLWADCTQLIHQDYVQFDCCAPGQGSEMPAGPSSGKAGVHKRVGVQSAEMDRSRHTRHPRL